MFTPFATNIWLYDGPAIQADLGFHYPTRMAVIRLDDGALLIWSPVALSNDIPAALADLGPVRHLVAPNHLHHMALSDWITAFPQARVYAPPKLRAKRPDIRFDDDLRNEPAADWAGQLDQVLINGNRITTEVAMFHRASGTVLIADLLQALPHGWFSGWRAWVARLDLMLGPEPQVPRKFRLAFTDRAAARASVATLLDWPAKAVVIAHGPPVQADGQATLQRAFAWLMK